MAITNVSDERQARRTERKRQVILDAATELFLQGGYLGTNMDEVAHLARVSKQTVYKHFASKETLFVEIVTSMTNAASDAVHNAMPRYVDGSDLAEYLCDYAYRQLEGNYSPLCGVVTRF
jgi:TetR/AcrR family transcriptional regulator, mexJK operon transcriptional repressor